MLIYPAFLTSYLGEERRVRCLVCFMETTHSLNRVYENACGSRPWTTHTSLQFNIVTVF